MNENEIFWYNFDKGKIKMLNEERKRIILDITNKRKSVSVNELMEELKASESTLRRDLNDLSKQGLIKKVHGGALALDETVETQDKSVSERTTLNADAKREIAKYCASLIKDNDVVYLDAGTSTGMMIPYLKNSKATFFTNGITHAKALSDNGHMVYLPGGMLKSKTEAIIGANCLEYIQKMNFTIGFFGTNGITLNEGFTTPDLEEAKIKEMAYKKSREKYILADPSKFNKICTVSFGSVDKGFIVTNSHIDEKYKKLHNTILVDLIQY